MLRLKFKDIARINEVANILNLTFEGASEFLDMWNEINKTSIEDRYAMMIAEIESENTDDWRHVSPVLLIKKPTLNSQMGTYEK